MFLVLENDCWYGDLVLASNCCIIKALEELKYIWKLPLTELVMWFPQMQFTVPQPKNWFDTLTLNLFFQHSCRIFDLKIWDHILWWHQYRVVNQTKSNGAKGVLGVYYGIFYILLVLFIFYFLFIYLFFWRFLPHSY